MFVALRTTDRSRVTSLDVRWDFRLDALRELAASGRLVCQGCEQKFWLRTGVKRRRHFAHRQLADCPLAHQSPELLEVKAQLYQWLRSKYPGEVHLDMAIGVPGWEKCIDLLVEAAQGRKFGYWAFDRQQRARDEFLASQHLPGMQVEQVGVWFGRSRGRIPCAHGLAGHGLLLACLGDSRNSVGSSQRAQLQPFWALAFSTTSSSFFTPVRSMS